jgi:acetylornithine deacetylase/succinyl-diaminopimelate desuccinylase-like protein
MGRHFASIKVCERKRSGMGEIAVSALEQVREYVASHECVIAGELNEFLRIPSVSAQPAHDPDTRRAAEWLRASLVRAGLQNARLVEGEGQPLVMAEWLHAPGKPTVLFYGHYDVQPPDPVDEWLSPPFEPEVRGENLYARGVADDKGLLLIWLKALEAMHATTGGFPVNVRVLCEGEEESSGAHLSQWLAEHAAEVDCDAVVICDTEMFAPEWPAITVGLRGIVYAELHLEGARGDLHSGVYGGVAPNPLVAAAQIISALKAPDGRITVPGFYDDVREISDQEREQWRNLPFDENAYQQQELCATAMPGEPGYSVLERLWARPTLDVHGIRGGYTGDGAKTVIPASATVKLSCRLVPDQNPERVVETLQAAIAAATPEGISAKLTVLSASPASLVDPRHPYVRLALETLTAHFENPASCIRSGGAIPVVGEFREHLGAPSLMLGFGLPDDQLHAPNEKLYLPNFWRGIPAVADLLVRIGKAGPKHE